MPTVLKIFFLLSTIWNTYITCTSPHPLRRPHSPIPQHISIQLFILLLIKISFISFLVIETTLILIPGSLPLHSPSTRITPQFLLGWLLNLLGGRIRQACYNELGSFFTFEIGMHENHKLITTGSYAVVRHPGYIGGLTALLGCLLVLNSSVWIPRIIWAVTCSAVVSFVMFILHRLDVEDEMLRKEFGVDWESWKEQVPYKLVPRIY